MVWPVLFNKIGERSNLAPCLRPSRKRRIAAVVAETTSVLVWAAADTEATAPVDWVKREYSLWLGLLGHFETPMLNKTVIMCFLI